MGLRLTRNERTAGATLRGLTDLDLRGLVTLALLGLRGLGTVALRGLGLRGLGLRGLGTLNRGKRFLIVPGDALIGILFVLNLPGLLTFPKFILPM